MTPSWLEMYASYIDSSRVLTASQLTFNAGNVKNAALLKIPMIPAGTLRDSMPLTIEITVAHDVSIGQGTDSDITYGVSDGTRIIGFTTWDKLNFNDRSPCVGVEGDSGSTFKGIRFESLTPKASERWGSCYTAHDGGFVRTAGFNNRLMFSKGLTLEVYKSDKDEKVGIRFIKVTIIEDEA